MNERVTTTIRRSVLRRLSIAVGNPETVSVDYGGTVEEGLIELAIKQLLELKEKQNVEAPAR